MSPWHSMCPRVCAEQLSGSALSGQLFPQPGNPGQPMLLEQSQWVQFHMEKKRRLWCPPSTAQGKRTWVGEFCFVGYQLSSLCPLCIRPRSALWSCVWSVLQGPRESQFSEMKGKSCLKTKAKHGQLKTYGSLLIFPLWDRFLRLHISCYSGTLIVSTV